MKIIDKIIKIFNPNPKMLEKPIEGLTLKEKIKVFFRLAEKEYSEANQEKMEEIIKSLPDYLSEYIVKNLDFEEKIKDEVIKEKIKKLYYNEIKDRYVEKQDLFEYIEKHGMIRKTNTECKMIFKNVIKDLNTAELNAFFNSLHTSDKDYYCKVAIENGRTDFNEENIKEILIDSDAIAEYFELFRKLPLDEQVSILKSYRYDGKLKEKIESLDEVDKIFYRSSTYMEQSEKINIDIFYNLIIKYNKYIENLNTEFNKLNYKEQDELREKIRNTKISEKDNEDFLRIKFILGINDKEEDSEVKKYFSIKDEKEKIEAFNNINDEIIISKRIYFVSILSNMDKEDFLHRFENKKGAINLIQDREDLTEDEIIQLCGEKENYTNIDLIQNPIGINVFKKLVDLNDFNFIQIQCEYFLKMIGDEEIFDLFVEFLKNYQKNEKLNKEESNKDIILIHEIDKVNLKKICEKAPELSKYISFNGFKLDDLIEMFDTCKKDKKYSDALFNKIRFEKKFNDKIYLDLLENAVKNNLFDKYIADNLMEIDIETFENILKKFDDVEKVRFLSYGRVQKYLNELKTKNPDLFEKELNNIDSEGKLLEMYKTLNKENVDNYNKNNNGQAQELSLKDEFSFSIDKIFENKDVLLQMIEEDSTVLISLNYKLFNILRGKHLKYFSKYMEMKDIRIADGENSYKLINEIINKLDERLEYPEEYIMSCIECLGKIGDDNAKILLDRMQIEELTYLVCKKQYMFKGIGKNCENILKFKEANNIFCDNIIKDSNSNLEQLQDAYTRRFYGMDLFEAKKYVTTYQEGLKTLLARYNEKELSKDEKMEYNALKNLQYIKEIISIKDEQKLKDNYFKLLEDGNFEFKYSLENLMNEEKVKEAYNKEKIENLYKPKEEDLLKIVMYNSKDIEIYKPNNFNLLISVVGAYIKNANSKIHPKESWNNKEQKVNREICTSLISNQNLSMAVKKTALKYGFYNLSPGSIEKEACRDISSNANGVKTESMVDACFRTTDNMINNIRNGHSEHLVERRINDNSSEKRQPDYIVVLDKVTKYDLKAASEFDVPIILLNSKEIAKNEYKEINKLKEEMNENISADDLDKLIVRYHNNYTGLFNINKKAIRKYFNPKEMEKFTLELVQKIENISNENEKTEIAISYLSTLKVEEEKRKDVEYKYIPFKFDSIKQELQKYTIKQRENNSWKQKYKTNPELPKLMERVEIQHRENNERE